MSIESVMPSNHLILCHPLFLFPSIFPSLKVYSNESLCIKWPKFWSFSFSISPSNEYVLSQTKLVHNLCSKFFFSAPKLSTSINYSHNYSRATIRPLCLKQECFTRHLKVRFSIVVIWWHNYLIFQRESVILLLIKRGEYNLNVLPEETQFKMYVLTGSQRNILLCKIFYLLILPCTEAQHTLFKLSVGSKVF